MTEALRGRMTLSEVATELDVHQATIYRWLTLGVRGRKLRSIFVGGRRFVLPADLAAFLAVEANDENAQGSRSKTAEPTSVVDLAGLELERRYKL